MRIILSPQRRDDTLVIVKSGDLLTVNGENFDFSSMGDGDTLPASAINCQWFVDKVDRVNGQLVLTVLFPNPLNYSLEQAFPNDLINVPDGRVELPKPLADESGGYPEPAPLPGTIAPGTIDWSQLVTKAMKDASAAAAQLAAAKLDLSARSSKASTQINRLQDRIDTIGFGIDIGEATEEDEAEQAALLLQLKAWKTYKFALGKVTVQPTWYQAPVWPVEPPIPEIIAAPMLATAETI
jgi:hypothetical protein